MNSVVSVEEYILKKEKWEDELILLHEIITSTELEECIKWGAPAYTLNNKNVIGIGAFKHHVAIWFFQGVFLSDKHKLLIDASEGTTNALRQIRFKSIEEINENIVLQYVREAIKNQKAGKVFKFPKVKTVIIPTELKNAFKEDPNIEKRFKEFSNSKQYEFTHYIAKAKREETRFKRVDKCIPLIVDGIGLNDKYR